MKQMLRRILYVQGFYLIILGLWPVLDIDGFMIYTGQKTDIWLVRTFGAMLACEGLCFIITGILREIAFPMLILAFLNSVLLLFVDMHYNFDKVLGESYLVEALFEMIFIVWWVVVFVRLSRSSRYRYKYKYAYR